MTAQPYRELFYTTQDGLRLFARDYGARASRKVPVICLPGLTRTSRDFDTLAQRLGATRRVLCADLRGRGRSQHCESWTDYTPANEMLDIFDLMGAAGIHKAALVGTSRGGIVSMLMAAQRPNAVAGVVFNDIGPEIEIAGLKRIAGYAGVGDAPKDWTEAAIRLRMANEREFPNLTSEQWYAHARRTFAEENGAPRIDYDAKIGAALRKGLEAANGPLPDMWAQFKAVSHVPALVLRGENSDILAAETAKRMVSAHPDMVSITVRDRGHVPFLDEPEAVAALDAFFERI